MSAVDGVRAPAWPAGAVRRTGANRATGPLRPVRERQPAPPPAAPTPLRPERRAVARVLDRYRAWERLTLDHPANGTVRRRFEATAYTLCVLMARRTSREAAHAAEHYLGVTRRRGRAIAPPEPDRPEPVPSGRPLRPVAPRDAVPVG
ncbi:DUF5133 domain-containing protein [Streptomyces evansiae]|uniref:DUF5133 domain-containing protein n=1 Tax=Streptomyces evansiae TaxID=3075535 RepID=UPI002888671F|nr:DUF5133 domain-containing protein [Streptomyces sp. DSM 41859]MDT0421780.1 DUF5133 domain-containing protein [Streptomyces sp. DSM 41859]